MDRSRRFDGVKFLWDGIESATEKEAQARRQDYESRGFQTRVVTEEGKVYVFTRRVAQALLASAA